MKPCPFCAELIQDKAIKCKYCHEFVVPPEEVGLLIVPHPEEDTVVTSISCRYQVTAGEEEIPGLLLIGKYWIRFQPLPNVRFRVEKVLIPIHEIARISGPSGGFRNYILTVVLETERSYRFIFSSNSHMQPLLQLRKVK